MAKVVDITDKLTFDGESMPDDQWRKTGGKCRCSYHDESN